MREGAEGSFSFLLLANQRSPGGIGGGGIVGWFLSDPPFPPPNSMLGLRPPRLSSLSCAHNIRTETKRTKGKAREDIEKEGVVTSRVSFCLCHPAPPQRQDTGRNHPSQTQSASKTWGGSCGGMEKESAPKAGLRPWLSFSPSPHRSLGSWKPLTYSRNSLSAREGTRICWLPRLSLCEPVRRFFPFLPLSLWITAWLFVGLVIQR